MSQMPQTLIRMVNYGLSAGGQNPERRVEAKMKCHRDKQDHFPNPVGCQVPFTLSLKAP